MNIKNWICYVALYALVCVHASAHEYSSGIHQWKVKGGTIYLTSGLVINGMALYVHNYNFYFKKDGDSDWYQIPLLEQSNPGAYELNVTSKAKDDRMVKDARLEIRNKDIYLLRAQSTRDDQLEDSPIVVTKYRLVIADEDWPFSFRRVSSKTFATVKDRGVDVLLKQEAQSIK